MRDKTLDRALWVGQVGLAASFLAAGGMKAATPMRDLRKKLAWTRQAPEPLVRFIGASEVAGAVGAVLPAATRIAPSLTGVAAASLATVMALASGLHIKRGEYEALPLTLGLGALAGAVAWGRLRRRPIEPRPAKELFGRAKDAASRAKHVAERAKDALDELDVKQRALNAAGIAVEAAARAKHAVDRAIEPKFASEAPEVDSTGREPVQHNYEVNVGDQVFLEEGGEEIGAVRKVERDHLVVYIEAAGDFIVRGPEVRAIHFGKVILEPEKVDQRLLDAARGAHENETY